MNTRRSAKEREAAAQPRPESTAETQHYLRTLLDQKLQGLSEKYRAAIVLCDLEGKPLKEAARQLGCPVGTLGARLTRGRRLLAQRLARHGLEVVGGSLPILLAQDAAQAEVPTVLAFATIKAAASLASGKAAAAGVISARAVKLMEGVLQTMLLGKLRTATVVLLAILVGLGVCAFINQVLAGKEPPTPAASQKPVIREADSRGGPKILPLTDYISGLAWTPDSKKLMLAASTYELFEFQVNNQRLTGSNVNSGIKLLDTQTGQTSVVLPEEKSTYCGVAISPDGKTVAVSKFGFLEIRDAEVHLLDFETGKLKQKIKLPGVINSFQFSPDSKLLAVGGKKQPGLGEHTRNLVQLWDLEKQQIKVEILGKPAADNFKVGNPAAFSPDGKLIATAELDGKIRLWDTEAGKLQGVLAGHPNGANALIFGRDGNTIISGSSDQLKVWDLKTGKAVRTLESAKGWVLSIAMSPDGKLLAVTGGKTDGNVSGKIFVYDTETWKLKATMTVDGAALELRFSPDGKTLAAACGRLRPNDGKSDGDVRLWQVADLLAGKK